MIKILNRGNNEGYSLLESTIATFIVSLLLLSVLGLYLSFNKLSIKTISKINSITNIQNEKIDKYQIQKK